MLNDSQLDICKVFGTKPKPRKHDVEKVGSGVMVAWFVPEDIASKLVVPDGESADSLHVTLGYFGKEVTDAQVQVIRQELVTLTQKYAPLTGTIGGIGRFPASESTEGRDVIIELVDVARLETLREEMLSHLSINGVFAVRNHGYTPHVTLAYVDPEDTKKPPVGEETAITITALTLAVAGVQEVFAFKGPEQLQLQKDMPGLGDVHVDTPMGNEPKRKKHKHTKFKPSAQLQENAKKGLTLWHPTEQEAELLKVAQLLAKGEEEIGQDELETMYAYLSSNVPTISKDLWDEQAPGYIALGGGAGLSWSRRMIRKLSEDETGDLSMEAVSKKIGIAGKIVKIDEDQQVVYAWASMASVKGEPYHDQQGDTISDYELEKAANHFVLNVRDAGEMHDKVGVGKLVASLVFTPEIQKALGIDLGMTGWFTGWQVTDKAVWKKIKDGSYPALSIHGTGMRQVL